MSGRQPLSDVRVVMLGSAITPSLAATCLAHYGAMVIQVESIKRPDVTRTSYPFAGNKPGLDRSGNYSAYHSNMYDMNIDLSNPTGIELLKRLVARSDVFLENFIPGTMEKWALDYEHLRQIKPDIIMARGSLQGQTGPVATQPGFGALLQAMVGFVSVIGWPDRQPIQIANFYTDFIGTWYLATLIIASLDYRRRTGKGQYIDLAQSEAALTFLSPAVLDYTINGREPQRMGNRSLSGVPHGAYRCQGDDRWCAIAVSSDEEWRTFCEVIGKPQLATNPDFATFAERKKNEDRLDLIVEEYTVKRPAQEVMESMQKAGVAAGIVEDVSDLQQDPQLKYRNHFQVLEHAEMGLCVNEMLAFRLTKTPAKITRPAPLFGEHTEYVLREIIGVSDEECVALFNSGVLE